MKSKTKYKPQIDNPITPKINIANQFKNETILILIESTSREAIEFGKKKEGF